MTASKPGRLAGLALLALVVAPAALALTLDEYITAVGEVSVAAIACNKQFDKALFLKIGEQFAQTDAKRLEELNRRAGASFQAADKRREAMGTAQYCAAIQDEYGPAGRKVKGLFK